MPAEELTALLEAAREGDTGASQRLFALVYQDLRKLAARHVRAARGGTEHQATSLVHEAFLRLEHRELPFADRTHFFAVASRAMRQIVIDEVRARATTKRGGGFAEADIEAIAPIAAPLPESSPEDLLALDGALSELEREQPRLARTVEWHFFGGFTFLEIAEALEVSERTVVRDWRAARALLHARLSTSPTHP